MKSNKREVVLGLILALFLILIMVVAVESYLYKKSYASLGFGNVQGQAVKSYLVRNFEGKQQVVDDGVLTIGVVTPLSTEHNFIGAESQKGLELALSTANRNNMFSQQAAIAYRDSQCDGRKALSVATGLVKVANADFIIGADCYGYSDSYVYAGEESQELLLLITPPSSGQSYDSFFSFEQGLKKETGQFWNKIRNTPATLSILFSSDEFGFSYKDALTQAYLGKVLSTYAYGLEETDFSATAGKIAARQPEAVFIVGQKPGALVRIVPALRKAGYLNQIFTDLEIDNDQLAALEKEERFSFESLVFITDFDLYAESVKVQEFVRAYREVYGENPSSIAAQAYDSLAILAELVHAYGQDQNQLAELLHNIRNYEGVTGLVTFAPDGVQRSYYLKTLRNGKVEDY